MGQLRPVQIPKFLSIVYLPTCITLRLSFTDLANDFIALSESLLLGVLRRVLCTAMIVISLFPILITRYMHLPTDPLYFALFLFVCFVCFALSAPFSEHSKQGRYCRWLPGFCPLDSASRFCSSYCSRTRNAAEVKPLQRCFAGQQKKEGTQHASTEAREKNETILFLSKVGRAVLGDEETFVKGLKSLYRELLQRRGENVRNYTTRIVRLGIRENA